MLQVTPEGKIICSECGTWIGVVEKDAICQGIKIYCKKCKEPQSLIVPCAGKVS